MGGAATIPKVKGAAPILLFAMLTLVLGGCGSEEASSGEGEATSAKTDGERSTPVETTGGAVPADIVGVTLSLTPIGDSGVSGTATLADKSGGLEVTLNVQNLPGQPGTGHPAHIHEGGTCADAQAGNEAPVQYPLEPAITGHGETGSSTTMIPDITVTQLFSGTPKYVDIHAETAGDEATPGVSCADIHTTTGGD